MEMILTVTAKGQVALRRKMPYQLGERPDRGQSTALRAGRDVADGAIESKAQRLGADIFHSFDHRAVTLLRDQCADPGQA